MNAKDCRTIKVSIGDGDEGDRLDVFLSRRLGAGFSRARIQALIRDGCVHIHGPTGSLPKDASGERASSARQQLVKSSTKVKAGETVELTVPPPKVWDLVPQDIPLDVVYEDAHLMVVNKPRGMVVHPAAGHREGTLVNAVLARCPNLKGIGGELRPGIVHRLDKDTTGLLVVAKDEQAFRSLQAQIKQRKVKRQYIALVRGLVPSDEGTIDAPIGRHPVDRKKMAVVEGGRKAVTDYKVLARYGSDYTLVLAKLRTGRTHQIRVHFSHMGHPVVGDPVYSRGKGDLGLAGQALHAARLGFSDPSTGEYLEFQAPLPQDFKTALETLNKRYGKQRKETFI